MGLRLLYMLNSLRAGVVFRRQNLTPIGVDSRAERVHDIYIRLIISLNMASVCH